jgi:hypothetical protein
MDINRDQRRNIAWSFDYIGGYRQNHFQDHLKLVRDGKVQYRWLVFATDHTWRDWKAYTRALAAGGVPLNALAKGSSKDSSSEPCEPQVWCRVIPRNLSSGVIPWRITMFGSVATLCSPESEEKRYGDDMTTVTIGAGDLETRLLEQAFDKLWALCPDVSESLRAPEDITDFNEADARFRQAFLAMFIEAYHKDVPIFRLEQDLRQSQRLTLATLALLLLTAATLVVEVVLAQIR